MLLHELKRAVVLRPQDPAARYALAEALFAGGAFRAAADQLEKALEARPDDANARSLLARAYQRDDRAPLAQRLLEQQVRRAPEDARARDELAELLLSLGRADDALLHLEVAARLEPSAASRLPALAELYRRSRLPERSLDTLRLARRMGDDPRLAEAHAELRLELGLPESAEVLDGTPLDRARQAAGTPSVRTASARAGLAEAAEHLHHGEPGAARRALVLASPSARDTPVFELLHGELLLLDGQGERAEAAWRRALERQPPLPLAALRLGDLACARGELDAALSLYERAAVGEDAALAAERRAALEARRRREALDRPAVGRLGALGWQPNGGVVSPLEAVAVPGRGVLHLTGNVGQTSQEAADVAFSCLKFQGPRLEIDELVRAFDLHLHFVDTELGKEGRSAGLAFALAGISAYTKRPLKPRLAATGEITLSGEVRPVAGLHEKLVAACLAGTRVVLHPRKNLREVREVPPEVSARVELIAVDTLSEALQHALART